MVLSFKAEHLNARYKDVFLTDVDGDHDLDAVLSTSFALHVYEHASDHSLSLPNQTQATSFPVNKIRLSGHATAPRVNLTAGADAMYLGYRPYLADWDLDGDLDLALLSAYPHFDGVHPRFFEHQADHSVSELRGGPNSSCPLNWSHPFSATDFDGDGQLDVVGMRRTDSFYTHWEVLVCLQSSDGYAVMNQAGFHSFIPQFQQLLIIGGEDDEADREMQYVCVENKSIYNDILRLNQQYTLSCTV